MTDQNSSPAQRTDVLIVTAVKDEQDVVLECEEGWREQTDPSGFAYFSRRDPGGLAGRSPAPRTWARSSRQIRQRGLLQI